MHTVTFVGSKRTKVKTASPALKIAMFLTATPLPLIEIRTPPILEIAIMELGYQCSCFHRRILFSIMKMEISEADNNTGEVSRLGSGLAGITNPKKCMTYA